jgi:hypothetical protein
VHEFRTVGCASLQGIPLQNVKEWFVTHSSLLRHSSKLFEIRAIQLRTLYSYLLKRPHLKMDVLTQRGVLNFDPKGHFEPKESHNSLWRDVREPALPIGLDLDLETLPEGVVDIRWYVGFEGTTEAVFLLSGLEAGGRGAEVGRAPHAAIEENFWGDFWGNFWGDRPRNRRLGNAHDPPKLISMGHAPTANATPMIGCHGGLS